MRKAIHRMSAAMLTVCSLLLSAIFLLGNAMPEQFSVVTGYDLQLIGAVRVSTQKAEVQSLKPVANLSPGSSYPASLNLFGLFPIKDVTVKVVDTTMVIPCGSPFGIKMYTDGVLVVGMSDVDTANGPKNPAKSAGMKVGDVLVMIDGKAVNTTDQVANVIEKAGSKTMSFRVRRDNIIFEMRFRCAKSVNENRWKAGLWVRDSSAGIGTLTFYVPGSNVFGGLGHAICDVDTGDILPLATGEVVPARIYSVVKGLSGEPGELRGGFEGGSLGKLTINSETGIYGTLNRTPIAGEPVPVAMKQQVKTGAAQIMATINGVTPQLYNIRIDQVRYNDSSPTRNMVIIITDERLLGKTGGIIQGMSGSPIIQDGKLVGAVTHVFVNDPTRGFAIFAENMLKTANTVQLQQQSPAA
ncbi:MAG: SpoIVB peptidase [Oscillospiraceae bacterium]|nr:SpoIVB peptidase [Oscillospiraceae bacterium]MDD3833424.1 SpoIVB peptidase [Oscillospiraceae bacterium]MDD4546954.1 SpoIVB peptidase [Oscillospiraceae bacterium]